MDGDVADDAGEDATAEFATEAGIDDDDDDDDDDVQEDVRTTTTAATGLSFPRASASTLCSCCSAATSDTALSS